jgi:hypothetical protein
MRLWKLEDKTFDPVAKIEKTPFLEGEFGFIS